MKIIIKILTYTFILIGSILLAAFLLKVIQDDKISFLRELDLEYLKKLGESAQVLSIAWSIIGVLLIVLTLNVQKDQFDDNRNFIEKQQFETTFFNMLNVLYNIKNSMKRDVLVKKTTQPIEGQNLIDYMKEDLSKNYSSYIKTIKPDAPLKKILEKIGKNEKLEKLERDITRDEINKIYLTFYSNYHTELGHFFRYLYNLIKFTRHNRLRYKDDKTYVNLIQAQLSNNELALVFYNVLSNKSLNKDKLPEFFNMLDDYNFFENIDEKALIDKKHHVLFPKTSFKFLNRDEIELKRFEI